MYTAIYQIEIPKPHMKTTYGTRLDINLPQNLSCADKITQGAQLLDNPTRRPFNMNYPSFKGPKLKVRPCIQPDEVFQA